MAKESVGAEAARLLQLGVGLTLAEGVDEKEAKKIRDSIVKMGYDPEEIKLLANKIMRVVLKHSKK